LSSKCIIIEDAEAKHAAILRNKNTFQLMDLCTTNGTSLKMDDDSGFETLDPLRLYDLKTSDQLKIGANIWTFHNTFDLDVVEATQATEPQTLCNNNNIFVAASEDQLKNTESCRFLFTPITMEESPAMPATEVEAMMMCEEEEDNYTSAHDEISQNVLAAVMDKTCCSDDDDELRITEVVARMEEELTEREGSQTPDILHHVKMEPPSQAVKPMQWDIPTQVNEELPQQPQQWDIATQVQEWPQQQQQELEQDQEQESELKAKLFMQPTQPMFGLVRKTRGIVKKAQAALESRIVPLSVFDDTQRMTSPAVKKVKKKVYNLETQPVFLNSPKTPIRNRILISSDEESTPEKLHNVKRQLASPMMLSQEVNSPDLQLPSLPSDSQLRRDLEEVNNAEDDPSVVSFLTDSEDNSDAGMDVKKENESPKAKRRRHKIMKFNDSQNAASIAATAPVAQQPERRSIRKAAAKKLMKFVQSNCNDTEVVKQACDALGGSSVAEISEADFLLTANKITLTAKVLAAMCRGLPIVSIAFLHASIKARKWLNPSDFLVEDKQTEAARNFELKKLLLKASKDKFLAGNSIFVTKSTSIPLKDLKQILACGDCDDILESAIAKPKYENLLMIYSKKDSEMSTKISKKYPKIRKISDTELVGVILKQEL